MVYLYRVRDAQDALLYIGVTENLGERFLGGHQHSPPWWPDLAALSVTSYPSIAEARAAERDAIAAERPLWNIASQPDGDLVMAQWERVMGLIRQWEQARLEWRLTAAARSAEGPLALLKRIIDRELPPVA
jgi:hypothetical protein